MGRSLLALVALAQLLSTSTTGGGGGSDRALRFTPPRLSLGVRPLGVAHVERVSVVNQSNRTVRLSQVVGDTPHFHSSLFEGDGGLVVPPNGSTSFRVVYLGRSEGAVDAALQFRTSEGVHRFPMSAIGAPSAYRLRPMLEMRLPKNATLSAQILLYNPHDRPIQIVEVSSSTGCVGLSLPTGALEGSKVMWFMPSHTTRPIVSVKYEPDDDILPRFVTSFVRIKLLSAPYAPSTTLVTAVEISALAEPGPYVMPQTIDFGYGGTVNNYNNNNYKKVRLLMGNSSPRPVKIASVHVELDDGSSHGFQVSPILKSTVPAFSPPEVIVASVTLHWKQLYDSGKCCGKVIIKTKSDQKIEVPFKSQPLSGGLVLNDESTTRFLSTDTGITTVRQVLLKNAYKMGLYVTDLITVKGFEKYFEITKFYPQAFKVNTIQHGFSIKLKAWTKSLKFESKVILFTNITTQEIPIYIYNGKLDLFMSLPSRTPKKIALDLGLVAVSSTMHTNLFLFNANPVPVCIKITGTNFRQATLQLHGCIPQLPATYDVDIKSLTNITSCTCIQPKWSAVFVVSVVAPSTATTLKGEVWITTVHEKLAIPITLTATNSGMLSQPEPAKFDNCFPGNVCKLQVKVKSSFSIDMDIISVETVPLDKRVYFERSNQSATISALTVNKIGWLYYDSYLHCDGRCYTGLDLNSSAGLQWLSLISLPSGTLESDALLVNSRYNLFTNSNKPLINLTIKLDTTQVRSHFMPVYVPLIWPRLYSGPQIVTAPLSQVGQAMPFNINLVNPSHTSSVLIHLVFDWMLWNNNNVNLFQDRLRPPECPNEEWCTNSSERAFYFSHLNYSFSSNFINNHNEYCNDKSISDCETSHDIDWLPYYLHPHPYSYLFILSPGEEKNVSITFFTLSPKKISSILYIRNNLTVIEMLRLTGEGVVASIKFGNRKPGSNAPLLFEITEKHLKDCDKSKKSLTTPNFTVKRTLIARNTGVIPVKITRFFINSFECEGYGFRVLNCEPFELSPNGTHKVDIAFTPDFTLTRVRRLLVMETSLNDFVNFTLIATIPGSLATKCAALIRRPSWESSLLGITVSVLTCLTICVIFAGCYESYKILTAMTASLMREPAAVQPPFDLRAIGQMGMNKKNESWNYTEYKLKDSNPTVKLHNWNCEDNYQIGECKPALQSSKFEEISVTNNRSNKKKVVKKNSTDSNACSQSSEHDKVTKEKSATTWKNVFVRNSPKCLSESNSSDSSEVLKSTNTPQETPNLKSKTPDSLKKATNESNAQCSAQQNLYQSTNKKHLKSKCHSLPTHSCEEDTSSTSAESSNNDDIEKERSKANKNNNSSNKKSSVTNNNRKTKCVSQCKDNYEGDGEDDEYDHKSQSSQSSTQNDVSQRWSKIKEVPAKNDADKQITEQSKATCHFYDGASKSSNRRENQKNNQKKDKQPLAKKRSLDKSFVFSNKSENCSQNLTGSLNASRTSPTISPSVATVWENKASFSDVVSRSDSSLSHNFTSRSKESQEAKKSDQKLLSSHLTTNSSNLVQNLNTNKMSIEDSRKCDSHSHSDLGPIGSNYYSKKSTWAEPGSDLHHRQFKPNHVQLQPELNPNPAYFYNSNAYFARNMPSSNASTMSNSFGSIGSSLNTANNISQMQYLSNNVSMMPNCDLSTNSLQHLRELSHVQNGNLTDYSMLDNRHTLDTFSSQNPWDQITTDNVSLMCNMSPVGGAINNESLFEADYNTGSYFEENKPVWTDATNLWSSSLNDAQNVHTTIGESCNQGHSNSPVTTSSTDCGAAEWLWGYNSNPSPSETTIPQVHSEATPVQSSHFYSQPQYLQQQDINPFDRYNSLNSIWSTGSPLDLWTNQKSHDSNNQELNNHSHSNLYN